MACLTACGDRDPGGCLVHVLSKGSRTGEDDTRMAMDQGPAE